MYDEFIILLHNKEIERDYTFLTYQVFLFICIKTLILNIMFLF